jgi:hypothetical protein
MLVFVIGFVKLRSEVLTVDQTCSLWYCIPSPHTVLYYTRGAQISHKSRSHPQILGATTVTSSNLVGIRKYDAPSYKIYLHWRTSARDFCTPVVCFIQCKTIWVSETGLRSWKRSWIVLELHLFQWNNRDFIETGEIKGIFHIVTQLLEERCNNMRRQNVVAKMFANNSLEL